MNRPDITKERHIHTSRLSELCLCFHLCLPSSPFRLVRQRGIIMSLSFGVHDICICAQRREQAGRQAG